MVAMAGRFPFKELRAPVAVIFMGAAKVFFIGVIAALFRMAPVQRDPLLVVVDLHRGTRIVDGGLLSYITVGDAVIALVRGEVYIAHLLDLRPSVIL